MDYIGHDPELSRGHSLPSEKLAIIPPALPSFIDLSPAGPSTSSEQFLKIVHRHRWKLAAFVCLAMAGAIVIQKVVPKTYEASTLVKVDRHSAGGVVGQEASQVSSVDDMDQIIATQIELVKSDPVLRPVADRYNLLEVEKQLKGLTPEKAAAKLAAPIVLKGLTVSRPPNSYLMRITYREHDPVLAANVANAVAESLTAHANDTGNRSSEEIAATVAQHMSKLRTKMEEADKQLVAFEKELNMDPEQRVTVQAARLNQLNTEYTSVQAERIRRESIVAELSKAGPVSLAAAQAAQAAAQDTTLLNETKQRLNAARQQFALVRSYYGEGHPEYVKAQQQVQEVQNQLDELQSGSRERADDEYKQALGREQRLQSLVGQTKTEVDGLKSRAYQYEQLKADADNYKKLYQELASQADIADINRQFQNASIQVVAPALAPLEAVFPRLLINLPVAFLLSGILGLLVVVLGDSLNTTFSDPEEFASQLRINVLSAMPATKNLPNVHQVGLSGDAPANEAELTTRYREGIRYLRSALTLIMLDKSIRTLLVTSAVPGEGKSTTSAYLSAACAQLGKNVLLMDADFRHPTLHKLFGKSNRIGLSDVLLGRPSTSAIIRLEQPGLYLMPVGSEPRRAGDMISSGLPAVLDEVSAQFDLVIVDCSPMLGVPESLEVARAVNSVLLVTKASSTTSKMVSQTLELLARSRANVMGVVMNQVKPSNAKSYGYGYGYGAYPATVEDEQTRKLGA
jgi:capsular exopolysaccharide synthesis family protein